MENPAARGGRRGEPARGGGAGGRRGRPHDSGEPHLGDPPGGGGGAPPLNGEQRSGRGGGGHRGGRGREGRHDGGAEPERLRLGGPAADPQGGAPLNGEESIGGGRGGGSHYGDPEQERLRLGGPAGHPQAGALRSGEESIGCNGGGGGRHNGDAEQRPLLPAGDDEETGGGGELRQGTLRPRDGKQWNAGGGRGSQNGDADQESHNLGGPDGQRADEDAACLRHSQAAGGGGCPPGVTGARGTASHVIEQAAAAAPGKKQAAKAKRSAMAAPSNSNLLSTFLTDAMLSWTLKEVLDDQLYKNRVQKVPTKFDSTDQFVDVYSGLLLEETRSSICAATRNHAEIQYCKLVNVKPCDSPSHHYLDIDLKMTGSCGIMCRHIAQDYDVCLLSDRPISESNLNTMYCCLALAFGIGRETFFQTSFRVLLSNPKNFQPERVKYVSFLTNIRYNVEISRALSLHDGRTHVAVEAILKLYKMVGNRCNTCPGLSQRTDVWYSQKQKYVIPSLRCVHQNNTEIIWAPPGSLKGSIAAVLKDFLHLRPKILICVPSPSSLPDIMMDLLELSISPDSGDVLVLNNTTGLGNCHMFENFSLEHQSQELYCCFTQFQGSLKLMSSVLDLSRYRHTRCASSSSCARCGKTELLNFSLEAFRKDFSDAFWYLRDCLVYLNNHNAAFYLLEHTGRIRELMVIMKEIEAMLYNQNLNSIYVEAAFELRPAIDVVSVGSAYFLAESLSKKRTSSAIFLRGLINSMQLPRPYNRDDTERLCIKNSSIIVSTVDCTWQLYGLEMDPFDILIVHGASQIKEDEFLIPLLLPVKQIVLFGDLCHLQPTVQSKICKAAGYEVSIFERLHQFTSEKQMLTHQFAMHPLISKFPNKYFYHGEVEDCYNDKSDEYSEEFKSLQLPIYGFMHTPTDLQQEMKAKINCVAISFLLQNFYEAAKDASRKFNICVVCISSNGANEVRQQLTAKKEIYSRVNVQVKPIDCLQGEFYDLIILSLAVQYHDDLKNIQENTVNVALTSSRHYLWMVGEPEILLKNGGIWQKLIIDAKDRGVLITMDPDPLQEIMKQLEMNAVNRFIDPNSAHSNQSFRMPGQEYSWAGRPERTKYILAHIRDQRGQSDTCAFQSSCGTVESLLKLRNARLVLPQPFDWDIFVDDLKNLYDETAEKPLQSEDNADRGEKRLKISLNRFRDHGVLGSNKIRTKFRRFKIKAYGTMDPNDTEAVTARLEEGGILIGHFMLSRNYYRLKPGEVYIYDSETAIRHPISGLPASHAAMMIGFGHQQTGPKSLAHQQTGPKSLANHLVMQNSLGKQFGIDGIGRVGIDTTGRGVENKQTFKSLYWIEVEEVKLKPASSTPRHRRRHRRYHRRAKKERDLQREASSSEMCKQGLL